MGHVNFSRRAGDLRSSLVANSIILVAMATEMVATWRVDNSKSTKTINTLFMSKQVSLPKISSILQKIKIFLFRSV